MSDGDNILQFPEPPTIIYICSCRCQSFRIYPTGVIECTNCGESHVRHADGTPVGEWVKRLPDAPSAPERTDAGTMVVNSLGSADFARANTMRTINDWAKTDRLEVIAAYHKDGTGKSWHNINNENDKQHVLRKLRELVAYIEQTKVY